MKQAFEKYSKSGFVCLPTKRDKSPNVKTSWNNGFTAEYFNDTEGIGLICGKLSGGLECLDFDNHFGDAKAVLTEFISIPEVGLIYEKYKLPIEQSQNGGYHLLFRCSKNEGNRKLAQRINDKNVPDAIIETRGQGGYFCAFPSKGYEVVKNDIFNVAAITEIERAVLIDNAVSMNEFSPIVKMDFESSERPGDLYNSNISAIDEMKGILSGAGWKEIGSQKWRRPGKDDGISATLGKVAPNVFYVFTSNAYPFEPMKAYTPFQVLGLLKYNGDFKEAAKSIAPHNILPVHLGNLQPSMIEKILLGAKIDTSKTIERAPTILSIKEQQATTSVYKRVFTLGNFSCIIGKPKSKKTFLLSILTSALLSEDKNGKFRGEMSLNKNEILYFDTEQGDYDSYSVIKRIEYMSGTKTKLRGFSLRPFSPIERCQIIEYAFELYGDKTGCCIIDGIADLAVGINDEAEASRVTTILLRLSKVYNCHITTIIHQNKNDGFATGHLGSSIMKKAEIIISVTKSKSDNNVSEVNCDMVRGEREFEPFDFTININGMPEVRGKTVKQKVHRPPFDNEIPNDFGDDHEEAPF